MILRVAARGGLNVADAADAHQATWIQLMRRADQLRDPDRLAGWLATTARRQSQRISIAGDRQLPCVDPTAAQNSMERTSNDVETVVLHAHYEPALQRALERLPGSYRRVLELLASDMAPSYEEVAMATGLPVGSIGPMRMRGLQMLRSDPELQHHRPKSAPILEQDRPRPPGNAASSTTDRSAI